MAGNTHIGSVEGRLGGTVSIWRWKSIDIVRISISPSLSKSVTTGFTNLSVASEIEVCMSTEQEILPKSYYKQIKSIYQSINQSSKTRIETF